MLISHILGEVLSTCDRIVVMRDGKVVASDVALNFDRAKLVGAMGGIEPEAPRAQALAAAHARGETPVVVRVRPKRQTGDWDLVAREGEIIGLAGLAGHGQTDLLLAAFSAASHPRAGAMVSAPVALVAGDRQSDGVSPGWSIADNIGVRSLKKVALRSAGLAPPSKTSSPMAWRERIRICTPNVHTILPLSGGNQQKALFARARLRCAHHADGRSDARRRSSRHQAEVTTHSAVEAERGRTFRRNAQVEELKNCDRADVFRDGGSLRTDADELNE